MGADYEAWSIRELQDECRARGLPSGRSKADLVARLTGVQAGRDGEVTAESDVPPRPADPPMEPQAPAEAAPTVFRKVFPTVPGYLDEASHLAYRRGTYEAALAAGLSPRGGELGARRAGTTAEGEVYEISLRPGARP